MAKPTDFVQGTLDLLILKTISLEPKHGWAIAKRIQRVSREVPGVEDVELELVFDPPWTPDKMSDDAKFILGFG